MIGDLASGSLDLGGWWFALIVPASIRVALIVLLTWGVAALLRGQGASVRSLVWTTGLTLALVLPFAAPGIGGGALGGFVDWPSTVADLSEGSEPASLELADDRVPLPALPRVDALTEASSSFEARAGAITEVRVDDGPAWPRLEIDLAGLAFWPAVSGALGLVALAGTVCLAARLAAGHLAGWRRTRGLLSVEAGSAPAWAASIAAVAAADGLPSRVRFVLGGAGASPHTRGVVRPTVVLPSDGVALPEAERVAVLRHELAHVVRLDTLWLLAERVLLSLFWWNSFVWPAQRRSQLAREQACDDAVLDGGATPSSFADQLLRQARSIRAGTASTGLAMLPRAESQLRRRVGAILDPRARRRAPRRAFASVVVGAMFVAACSASSIGVETERGGSEWLSGDGVRVEERDDETRVSIEEGRGRLTATVPAGTRFASDTEIAAVDAGTLHIEDGRERTKRAIEAETLGDAIELRYYVDGDERELDAEGRAWFEATLLELFRRAGVDREARVGRLHDAGGAEAVLAETRQIEGDFVAASYLEGLLALPALEDGAAQRVIEELPELVGGSFLRARVIERLDPDALLADAELRDALIATLRTLDGSPFELGRTVEQLLPGLAANEAAFASVLRVGVDVRSDFERARLLSVAAVHISDAGQALDAWLDVAAATDSSFEQSRALERLIDRSAVSVELRLAAIELVAHLGGDFSRAQLLVAVADRFTGSEVERDAYRSAARSIRGDFERGRALAAIDGYASR